MPVSGRRQLAKRLHHLGLTEREAETAIETLIKSMVEGLAKDGKIIVSGFGSFNVRTHKPRTSRLPHQEPRRLPARKAVRFKASTDVFKSYNGGR